MVIAVLHLVYTPLGEEPVRRFLKSYDTMRAGTEHRLTLILNGGSAPWFEMLANDRDVDVCRIESGGVLDLDAYRLAVGHREADAYCFLNSYSELRAGDWLRKLVGPLRDQAVGMTGAGGSFETMRAHYPWTPPASVDDLTLPGRLRKRLGYARARVWVNQRFPRFPNVHVRTNAFALRSDVIRRLDWPVLRTKPDAWALESGRNGFSSQVQSLGLGLRVVGADGRAFAPADWPDSGTVRSHDQRNLLVADNRTEEYSSAPHDGRGALRALAWGGPDETIV